MPLELNKEFEKYTEIIYSTVETEFRIKTDDFLDYILTAIENLKFICLKYDLCYVDELENLNNLENEEILNFCADLKNNTKKEFLDNIFNNYENINKVELNKNFNDFNEVYEATILTKITLWHFGPNELYINKLKFICLKYELYDANELEIINIRNLDKAAEFISELQENIVNDLKEKILNKQ